MLPIREKVPHSAVRILFKKYGDLQYISHLDLHRTFTRMLVRAEVPVWYSEGFSPHPRLVFATPLSVGSESVYELVDVNIIGTEDEINPYLIFESLKDTGIKGLEICDVYFPRTKLSELTHSDYTIRINCENADEGLAKMCGEALKASPLPILKRTKSGEREVDISSKIRFANVSFAANEIVIKARLSADSAEFLNPEYIVKVLREKCGVLSGNPLCESYSILRTAVFKDDKLFR